VFHDLIYYKAGMQLIHKMIFNSFMKQLEIYLRYNIQQYSKPYLEITDKAKQPEQNPSSFLSTCNYKFILILNINLSTLAY